MTYKRSRKNTWIILTGAVFAASTAFSETRVQLDQALLLSPEAQKEPSTKEKVSTLDATSRDQVVQFYQLEYRASEGLGLGWTGSVGDCDSGDVALGYNEATIRRVNYFRAMAGLPNVLFDPFTSAKCQDAALMLIAEGALSHTPDPGWSCFTADGQEAVAHANIAIGTCGPDAIDMYMEDPGDHNYFAGHRRWILYPRQESMGTGSTDATHRSGSTYFTGSNVLWVTSFGSRPAGIEGVSWPPAGYVPYQTVYPRWSFSFPQAEFSEASITMTRNGYPVDITINPIVTRAGDNTIVWEPKDSIAQGNKPGADTSFEITISNVIISGTAREFNYVVAVIDPDVSIKPSINEITDRISEVEVGFSNLDINGDKIVDAADIVRVTKKN